MAWNVSGGGQSAGIVTKFPVIGGRGLLSGDSESATVRALIPGGGVRIDNGDALQGNPYIYSVPAITRVAYGTINAALTTPQMLTLVEELDEVEITDVSIRRFSTNPSAALKGGIYAAPPAGSPLINPPDAMVVSEDQQYNTWAGGLRTFQPTVVRSLRRLAVLYWCPKLSGGSASTNVNPFPLTFDVEVYGLPAWSGLVDV